MTDHDARTGPPTDPLTSTTATDPAGPDPVASPLTHFDERGHARMVDVGDKDVTHRVAIATGEVRMAMTTMDLIRSGRASKGDVLGVARVAGIMGAKRTPDLIPMCHPLLLTKVTIDFELHDASGFDPARVTISARVETRGQTGVEMEALTAVSVTGLTIYDMLKAVDRGMEIGAIRVEEKHGGRSGDWHRPDQALPPDPPTG